MKCLLAPVLLLLCQEALGARWDFTRKQSLDSDLDSLLCSSHVYDATIIDIHASMENGAELLDGRWSQDLDDCTAGCCSRENCDLALFKNEGASKSGKNCYYVHCGDFRNCVMVEHSAFTSVAFGHGDRTGHGPHVVTTRPPPSNPPPRHHATPASSRPATPPPRQPAHTPTTPSQESTTALNLVPPGGVVKGDKPSSSAGKAGESTGEDNPSSAGEDNPSPGNSSSTSNTSSTGTGKDTTGKGDKRPSAIATKGNSAKGDSASKDGKGKGQSAGNQPEDLDDCAKYGCDGSGVVAIVVVGVICFVIVLVVVAILLKKVVDDRRKRRFKNVDYLINGMYT